MGLRVFSTEGFNDRENYVYITNRNVRGIASSPITNPSDNTCSDCTSSPCCCNSNQQWRYGSGIPSVDLGNLGDFYLDTITGDIYNKDASNWVFVMNITGPSGSGDLHYEHDQLSPQLTWNIAHNLGKYPSVSVVDSGGNVVIGDVEHVDTNNLVLTFSSAFSGKAYCN